MYEKGYVIDTNVILHDHNSVKHICDYGNNLILLPETVLDELDKFKVGSDTINYNARRFINYLSKGDIVEKYKYGVLVRVNNECDILILKQPIFNNGYIEDLNNDKKIIYTIESYLSKETYDTVWENPYYILEDIDIISDIKYVSNDIMFRTHVNLLTTRTSETYQTDMVDVDNIKFIEEYNIDAILEDKNTYLITDISKYLDEDIPDTVSYIKVTDNTGKLYVLYKNTPYSFKKLDLKKEIVIHGISPRNLEQRMVIEMLLEDNDVCILEGKAGTGKTLLSLLAAIHLIDRDTYTNSNKYKDIIYIRKTINAGEKIDELGFLPGDLDNKLKGYIKPMRSNIEYIIKKSIKGNITRDELDKQVDEFESKYNIRYEYLGHERGNNLSGIIILDEAQNFTKEDILTLVSRITDGSKLIILGCLKQIDHPYLNKYNNGLAFLMENVGNNDYIDIKALRLNKVVRGKIASWIESITDNK